MRLTKLIALLPFLAASPALAWGKLGHRVTGEIAQAHIGPQARAQVAAILGAEDLAQASTWADDMRSNPDPFWQKAAGPFHYVTVPPGKSYDDVGAPPEGDSVTALQRFVRTLRDPKASRDEKALALRFVVHIVGDLHQPLHAGNGTDKGGNDVRVTWFGRSTNLHAVWDSEIVDGEALSYTEMTAWLRRDIGEAERKAWWTADPRVWIAESAQLRDTIYPASPSLSFDYSYRQLPVAKRRIAQAGIRIAAYLDWVFAAPRN
jgi:hypothetical protein